MYLALIYGGKFSLFIFTVTLYNTRCAALFLTAFSAREEKKFRTN